MKRGFGWHAWLDARRRLSGAREYRRKLHRLRADERAARAALRPRTGDVASSTVNPPMERKK